MKKFFLVLVLLIGFLFLSTPVYAVPTLQLDIVDGIYDPDTETIVAAGNPFSLVALLKEGVSFNKIFHISAALFPSVGLPGDDLGSFSINGDIYVTDNMTYGTPTGLPPHGIFPTYYYEFEADFTGADTVASYDTATGEAGPPGELLLKLEFEVDTSLLDPAYVIHFDLYGDQTSLVGRQRSQREQSIFILAPFSHDAESPGAPVPEPATMLLLGSGLVGLAAFGRRKLRKK